MRGQGLIEYRKALKKPLTKRDIQILKAIQKAREKHPHDPFLSWRRITELKRMKVTEKEIKALLWKGLIFIYRTGGIHLTPKGKEVIK